MIETHRNFALPALAAAAVLVSACGGGAPKRVAIPTNGTVAPGAGPTTRGASTASAGVLSAEARSGATGDIPDTQVFVTLHDGAAGYSMSYPEGWTRSGAAGNVTLRDKNNLIHVVVGPGSDPTPASVRAELVHERASSPSLAVKAASSVTLPAGPAVKATYTTVSAPNPVTGKRVTLTVDRYVFAHRGRRATLDLGTPVGVDNVDAYRMISRSFRWL